MEKQDNPARTVPEASSPSAEESTPVNHAHEQMLRWLSEVRFRRKLFGGVDERDLWKKLNELNDLYNSAISAERARYDALLAAQQKSADSTAARYKAALAETRGKYNALVRRMRTANGTETSETQQPRGEHHEESR